MSVEHLMVNIELNSLSKLITAWHATFQGSFFDSLPAGLEDWTRAICIAEIEKYGEIAVVFATKLWFHSILGKRLDNVVRDWGLTLDYSLLEGLVVNGHLIYNMEKK